MMEKNNSLVSTFVWKYPKENKQLMSKIIKELHLHPIAARIFVSRGFQSVQEIREFLYLHVSSLLNPYLFVDMDKAVQRILVARETGEKVMIYGDSDVDGITGVALLVEFFQAIGIDVHFCFLGSLLKQHSEIDSLIAQMKQQKVSLLITVDCGITAGKEIKEMRRHGIDVIVTDHHMPLGKEPRCVAVLNPKLQNQTYPNQELTGVGVTFKLASAILEALSQQQQEWRTKIDLNTFLDLVSLGTITDVGTLVGENRVMVRYGIKEIEKGSRLGLQKLCALSGVNRTDITSLDIVLKIAPKLNSLGRLTDPTKGVDLLLTRDHAVADAIIKDIDMVNRERQQIEAEVYRDVQSVLKKQPNILQQAAIVLSSSRWHSRVIPIISAKLAKTYSRPVAIISKQGGIGKGSLRTVSSCPLLGILQKCAPLFLSYGGHDLAAGIILEEDKIESFRKKFIHLVQSSIRKEDRYPTLSLDGQADFAEINHDLLASIDLFEPFGKGNPVPVFYAQVRQIRYPKLLFGNHIKLYLNQGDRNLEGVAFGFGDRIHDLKASWHLPLSIAYTPRLTRTDFGSIIRLIIRDFSIASSSRVCA